MLTVSALTLNILAAFVWYVGGAVLLIKGGSLLLEAHPLKPGMYWTWIVIAAGLCFGGLKGRFTIIQTDYGIKPFKAMMGTLKIKNAIDVGFDLSLN